ncbi:MAG TPA: protein translocase subunit SecD [Candidatus Saccharimonadales bacterium]|jgi:preprotein translocase subunit SecD|nr:protein translocase subunit SecD [Candidatus Saccharimonadales bacterium]
MQKNIPLKIVLIVAIMLVFTALIFLGNPSDWPVSVGAIKQRGLLGGLQESIHLGLDLQGGAHFIYQVKVNEAISSQSDGAVELLNEEFVKAKVAVAEISKPDAVNDPDLIVIKGLTGNGLSELNRIVNERLPDYSAPSRGAEGTYLLRMKQTDLNNLKNRTVDQSIIAIRNRIDTLGVREPIIQQHGLGDYQILIQLPGADDTARIRDLIQKTARLEVRQVFRTASGFSSEQEALTAFSNILPPNTTLMRGHDFTTRQDRVYVVAKSLVVGGTDLKSAETSLDRNGQPEVVFHLTVGAGKKFTSFTGAHNEENGTPDPYLAIILDNEVREAASIKTEIGDTVSITGGFDPEKARDLATLLNSGSLPASLVNIEERTVGASLGADSIRHGIQAAIFGMAAVMVFMLVYYRFSGVNANLALILNLVILLGFLGVSGASLTLPGIAGVILTVGMGVDSNVLIFERIREELRNGKAPPAAVDQGFGRAWLTIIDTHVTTIVSAAILILFGTGPVRGFAITLIFGLLANLFTAVFVSRVIFDAILGRKDRGEALSI